MEIAPESNVLVMYNAVPLPVFDEKPKEERDTVNITFLGLIGERKGIFDLIEVISRLTADGCNIHLTVGGNGDISRFHKEIEMKNLKNHVTYVGWIVGDEKDKLLRNTDIFVLPSYGEGMPMTILEAMSYAIPVISTNVGGVPEIVVDGETGYLIEAGDRNALYDKILGLVNDKAERNLFGKNGRDVIKQRHDIQKNTELLSKIYDAS